MTTTTVSDAVILPQSQGTGLSGENATIDAAINGVLNRYVGGEYVSSTYSTGLAFQNHNASNDTVEVGPGIIFVQDNSTSTSGERGSGGNPQAESSTTSGYDTELPEGHTYAVLLPTATQISVTDSTLNEVYIDIDDVTANNSVNLEHDGSTTASPGNTSLKIGETNPDDASADTRANDDASPTYNSLTVNGTTDTDTLNADGAVIGDDYHFAKYYDGADADSRLDNALAAADAGDRIFLEQATYSDNRNISTRGTTITGVDSSNNGTIISGTWTLSGGEITLEKARDATVDITAGNGVHVKEIQAGSITCVDTGSTLVSLLTNLKFCDVTFETNTSTNAIDSSVDCTVTDNGNNQIGEV